jgi:16S rRNA (adenine1518-N6/adenine1519-N6)-dimethyltransferase
MNGHIPRRRFGQNFLVDRGIVRAIVELIAPRAGDNMVEIGPGLGALTAPLLERLDHLHVIEIDRDIVARLQATYAPMRLTIHAGDVLEFDFAALPAPLRVVGNLPYNISTELLFRLVPQAHRLADAHFMLQREVVERMVAAPSSSEYGRLSVMLQHRFYMDKLLDVPPEAFRPAPKVHSAIVRMIPRPVDMLEAVDPARFGAVVTTAFTKRRKTLRNALSGLIDVTTLEALGIDARLRPENLSVADYVAITHAANPVTARE